jgi:hypothetical protein
VYNSAIHCCGETAKIHQVALSAVKMQSARNLSVLFSGKNLVRSVLISATASRVTAFQRINKAAK